ncbi:SDR family NAD(P)-dependent oxidoreductase [Mesorhizobium muleiense]|uniref:SDR family NAD(P)-dependent oxidoreductase n=1 Tax=Mesorhizobium muleiense TaxID=1004279 RepID=UPI0022A7F51D|nr:SDR family oxidoreductase [Mesorhizobium muleiense]
MMISAKVAIVPGGSSGTGRAAALALARQGAKFLITGRRPQSRKETAALHKDIIGFFADVAVPGNAGALLPLRDATAERINTIFAVNVVGPSLLTAAALPHLEATKGPIVNISSTFGHKPGADLSHYAASKAALEHLTRCWALELAPEGLRDNAVAAGPTESSALTGHYGPLSGTCRGDRGGGTRTATAQAPRNSG